MRERLFHFLIALSPLLLQASALAHTQTPQTPTPKDSPPQADRDFNKATQEKGLEGWMQFMADDVILLRGKPVFGKDSVSTIVKSDWDEPGYSLTWEPKRAELFKSGKMGDTSGRWTYRGKHEKGEKITLQGHYLHD